VADDDLRIQIALLTQQVANLIGKIADVETRSEKRIEKLEGLVKWGALLMGSAVIAQVLRSAGIGI